MRKWGAGIERVVMDSTQPRQTLCGSCCVISVAGSLLCSAVFLSLCCVAALSGLCDPHRTSCKLLAADTTAAVVAVSCCADELFRRIFLLALLVGSLSAWQARAALTAATTAAAAVAGVAGVGLLVGPWW